MLSAWDEFSHWGRVVKNMYFFDALGNHPDSTSLFRGYPPSTALFHYFWMKMGEFSEPNLYRSMGVLGFSLLLPVMKNIGWNSKKVAIVVASFVIMVPMYLFGNFYTEIYVDAIMGILVAYSLFIYFTEESYNIPFMINITLALSALTLVKAAGFGLAISVSLVIIADNIIKVLKKRREENQKGGSLVIERVKNTLKSKYFCISAITMITTIATNLSWSIYRNITDTAHAWGSVRYVTIPAIIELLTGRADPEKYAILDHFIRVCFTREIFLGRIAFPYFQWVALTIVIVSIWLFRTDKSTKDKLICGIYGVIIGWLAYMLSVVLIYLYAFPFNEAIGLDSFNRYMNTYFIAVVCSFSLLFVYYINEREKLELDKKFKKIITFIFIPVFLFNFGAFLDLFLAPPPSVRSEVTIGRVAALELDYKTDAIHYIFQNSNGFQHYIAQYEMTPVPVNREILFWSIGTPYPGDQWTRDISLDEWLDILRRDYTYVYLEHIDDQFIEQFGGAFERITQIKNQSLFKVVVRDNTVILEYIEL